MKYETLLNKMGLEQVAKLAISDLNFDEILGVEIPFFQKMGCPPALVPFANSIGFFTYIGAYIYDIRDIKFSFVELMLENSKVIEVGLNERQFCHYWARTSLIDFYEEDDEDLAEQVMKLCSLLGVERPLSISQLDDEEFLQLDIFKDGVPVYLLNHKAGTTMGNTGFDKLSRGDSITTDLKKSFDSRFRVGKYQEAWEILNSPGWPIIDAKADFKRLVDVVDNDIFTTLYEYWSQMDHPTEGY